MADSAPKAGRDVSSFSADSRWHKPVVGLISVGLFLAVWEMAPRLGWIDPFYTSAPARMYSVGLEVFQSGELMENIRVSLVEFCWGFALALLAGIPLGLLLGTNATARALLDPLVTALYCMPRLALLPVIIMWLGIGMESKVVVVLIGAVLPIIVNTMAGIREVDPNWARAAVSFGASRLDVFVKVLLPGSVPAVLTGVRLGLGRGILGVVIAEMYVSVAGVGHLIVTYGAAMRVDHLVFYSMLVSVFGFAAVTAVGKVEERLQSWRGD
ncbi:MAG: hypothetical protein A3G25_03410 [Betaproteobacteria bacterium RIFCSPLOWO2_12_FULL_63_13]|nr:MAG: hypothetical protein A3H32_13305 [Betaproteobacteria bacterium RIFCSPLOWO2_02_FULL_63_19]OGA43637.1 MAG: hypothetical protein A3G25_03410 [Betaproteobacteria bacterium RIFCSPLOWO2_12_FULL_63_13]